MFNNNEPAKFGGENVEQLLRQIDKFYSQEEQERYGVVGIQFEKLEQNLDETKLQE